MQLATLSLFPTKGRAHLFKRKSTLFEFESSSSRTKNRSAPHFSFPRKPEGEFKKNNNFFLLALYGKNEVGKNFSSCIEYGGCLSTWEKEEEEEKKLISFPFSLHNFSTVRLRNWHYVKSFLLFHFPSGPIINFF